MKVRLKMTLALLLMFALVLSAVGIGAYRGWSKEYKIGLEALQSLDKVLLERKELAYNITVVAKRHMTDKAEYEKLIKAADILVSNKSLSEKYAANEELTKIAEALLNKLSKLDSVKNDSRDNMYVSQFFPQILKSTGEWEERSSYNDYVNKYNTALDGSLSGKAAQLLGIKKLEGFSSEGGL